MPLKNRKTPKDFINSHPSRKKKIPVIGLLRLIPGITLLALVAFILLGIRDSRWDNQTRLNIISVNPPELISLDPPDNEINIIPLPQGFKLRLAYGYGDYRFDKVFALDKQEKKNGRLLSRSVENLFGLPVIGWIDRKHSDPVLPGFRSLLLREMSSNLSFFDLVRFVWFTTFTPASNVQTVDLSSNYLIKAQNNIDGSVDLVLVQDKWDQWVRKNIFDPAIDKESLTVTVVNDTNYQGLGNQVARQIENLGASVVRVITGSQSQDRCSVVGAKDNEKARTVAAVKHLFSCSWLEGDTSSQRADIVVNIGQDYWKSLNQNE